MRFEVTNHAPGPRNFQCVSPIEGSPPDTVTLIPGAMRMLDLVDRDHPVLKAWAEAKEVSFASVDPPKPPTKG